MIGACSITSITIISVTEGHDKKRAGDTEKYQGRVNSHFIAHGVFISCLQLMLVIVVGVVPIVHFNLDFYDQMIYRDCIMATGNIELAD